MQVIINDRPLHESLTGVGHYVDQLLLHLGELEPEVKARPFYFTHVRRGGWPPAEVRGEKAPAARPAEAVRGGAAGTSARRRPWWVRRLLERAYGWAFRAIASGYELYHEPNHIPIASGVPTVTTIHDLSVLVHPEWHPADRVRWYEREFARGLAQTRRHIAVSEFTRTEMVRQLGVPPESVTVTYQAPRPVFRPRDPAERAPVLARLGVSSPFFLYVGTLEPRKNVAGLLDAYGRLPEPLRRRFPLLLAGGWGWKGEQLRRRLEDRSLAGEVRQLGYLTDDELACLYSAAIALLWPTLYEGFGMPPLEAMACGAAVVTSAVASLPEVVGDAGVLLDPQDTAAWSETMERLAGDDGWRASLEEQGLERARRFSWQACAAETVRCYRAVLCR